MTLADKLRESIALMIFEGGLSITASFGVAQLKEGQTVYELLSETNSLLYDSKHNGRNQVSKTKSA